jgi:hypothetical protein
MCFGGRGFESFCPDQPVPVVTRQWLGNLKIEYKRPRGEKLRGKVL